ncbi:MAG: PorV/PorQ family protein [Candidatus Zixiibacteriota bacterium]
MFKYVYILLFVVTIFFSFTNIFAGNGDGGYAASFQQVPIGARPSAMGGTYIAIADDGAGMFFNSAGIADRKNMLFSSSYRAMKLDRTLGYASFIFPTRNNSALGLSWLYAGSGSVEARNTDGDLLDYEFSQNNHVFSIGFAKRFENYLTTGFRASYMHTSFAKMISYTVSFDLGLMLYVNSFFDRESRALMPVQDIQIGFVVRNLAANYRWNNDAYFEEFSTDATGSTQEDDVPLEFGLGSSARFFERKLLVASDIVKNEKQNLLFHGGMEYFVKPEFSIRGGFTDSRLTAGTGYIFKFNQFVLAVDYAFSTDKVEEGSEHIFSFDFLF